ncbi:MAG: hypothetical protein K2X11_22270 [Acetobacteraceae bacterium]|nr:hypothetical protein [Acetobacteraceae bacterium]
MGGHARRPSAARDTRLARRAGLTPNQVSALSVVCAAAGAVALMLAPGLPWLFRSRGSASSFASPATCSTG